MYFLFFVGLSFELSNFMFVSHYHNFLRRAPGAELVRHSDHIVPPVEDELKDEALSNTQTHQIAYGQEAPFSAFGLVPSLSALGQPVNTESAETQARGISCHSICIKNYPFYLFYIFLITASTNCSLEIPMLQLYH